MPSTFFLLSLFFFLAKSSKRSSLNKFKEKKGSHADCYCAQMCETTLLTTPPGGSTVFDQNSPTLTQLRHLLAVLCSSTHPHSTAPQSTQYVISIPPFGSRNQQDTSIYILEKKNRCKQYLKVSFRLEATLSTSIRAVHLHVLKFSSRARVLALCKGSMHVLTQRVCLFVGNFFKKKKK